MSWVDASLEEYEKRRLDEANKRKEAEQIRINEDEWDKEFIRAVFENLDREVPRLREKLNLSDKHLVVARTDMQGTLTVALQAGDPIRVVFGYNPDERRLEFKPSPTSKPLPLSYRRGGDATDTMRVDAAVKPALASLIAAAIKLSERLKSQKQR
jgi:hypothetical protein